MTRSTTRCSPTNETNGTRRPIYQQHTERSFRKDMDQQHRRWFEELVLSTGQFTTYNEKNGLMNNQDLQNRRRER